MKHARRRLAKAGDHLRGWISLHEASLQLGVSATTLRRWADTGLISTFVTPGGHRRFDSDSIHALLPGQRSRPTMAQLGETPERMARAYRRAGAPSGMPWISALDEQQRTAFREHGVAISRELLAALDAATERERADHLATASTAAAEYGMAAAGRGVGISATVEAFLRFRRTFVVELFGVARRRGLEVTATTDLVGRADDAVDELLVATVRAWESTVSSSAPDDAAK